jgi:hypothetical protein
MVKMPGFSAEAALYERSGLYGTRSIVGLAFEAVQPQQQPACECHRCGYHGLDICCTCKGGYAIY